MNVGFVEASTRFPAMDCVMFHDVDHLLEDDRALMNCGQQPHHYAAAIDEWNYRSRAIRFPIYVNFSRRRMFSPILYSRVLLISSTFYVFSLLCMNV